MSEKRNAYYRKRRVGAAELERLHAEGQRVHPDAIEWARLTLASVDDVGGRTPAVPRQDIVDLLAKYPTTGLTIAAVAEHFGQTVRCMTLALYMLRKLGQVASVKHISRVYYFPSKAAAESQRPRFLRERQDLQNKQAQQRNAVLRAGREAKAAARGKAPRAPAPAPAVPKVVAKPAKPPKAAAPPPAMRAAPSIATTAKQPAVIVGLETAPRSEAVQYPPHRFWVDPKDTVQGGFREEFQILRAGGAEA